VNQLAEDLLQIADDQTHVLRELTGRLQQKRRLMIQLDVSGLEECNKQTETLVLRLQMLSTSKAIALEKLSRELNGRQTEHGGLTALVDKIPQPLRHRLEAAFACNRSLAAAIQELNRSNIGFIEHSLDTVRGSLSLLRMLQEENPTYHGHGRYSDRSNSGRLISREV